MRAPSMIAAAAAVLVAFAGHARADDRPRMLVLPLPVSTAVDADTARAFDARLLVALDDTRKVITLTATEEPECTTTDCLVALGIANDAALVVLTTAVQEDGTLTLFGTVVDTQAKAAARRFELAGVTTAQLAKRAPAQLAPQIVGGTTTSGAVVVGMMGPAGDAGAAATTAVGDYLAAYKLFDVVPLDGMDRSGVTYRAEIAWSELSVQTNRRWLCDWYDGHLTGTFTITQLATGKTVFTKSVDVTRSEHTAFATADEVTQELVDDAVLAWLTAFRDDKIAIKLARAGKKPAAKAGSAR